MVAVIPTGLLLQPGNPLAGVEPESLRKRRSVPGVSTDGGGLVIPNIVIRRIVDGGPSRAVIVSRHPGLVPSDRRVPFSLVVAKDRHGHHGVNLGQVDVPVSRTHGIQRGIKTCSEHRCIGRGVGRRPTGAGTKEFASVREQDPEPTGVQLILARIAAGGLESLQARVVGEDAHGLCVIGWATGQVPIKSAVIANGRIGLHAAFLRAGILGDSIEVLAGRSIVRLPQQIGQLLGPRLGIGRDLGFHESQFAARGPGPGMDENGSQHPARGGGNRRGGWSVGVDRSRGERRGHGVRGSIRAA